jgi:hypothetical protein
MLWNVWPTPDEGSSPYSFSGSCIPSNESLLLLAVYLHWHRQFNIIIIIIIKTLFKEG